MKRRESAVGSKRNSKEKEGRESSERIKLERWRRVKEGRKRETGREEGGGARQRR